MGLEGMIEDLLAKCSPTPTLNESDTLSTHNWKFTGQLISLAENFPEKFNNLFLKITASLKKKKNTLVLGITGTGGAGKSSLVDELVRRFLH